MGKTITVETKTRVHYDQNLRQAGPVTQHYADKKRRVTAGFGKFSVGNGSEMAVTTNSPLS